MTPEQLKAACLAFNGSGEEFPFPRNPDVSVFKVGGKIFALSTLTDKPLTVSLKCDPELALRLRAEYPAIVGGYHLNKRHWNTVTLDGSLEDALVLDMIEDSYDLIVSKLPRMERLKLDWPGERARSEEIPPGEA
ncbi:MmcQ/YjbR family DNA-binding protein [Yinghuangia seranimata]|uniref:MmcQ/YjbR family DNA-binding protein n=1 Tax=Yinghuangia seranimata TaxID=408067 RepID=UPI00248CB4D4|nr:MmcQ/YjbR family DNA-binding protein [Yinghuangia seranimata]MDI2131068.1 MmcQ/YjbR family DNA-binding protein [Yinghuangia seranimata]